MDICSAIQNHQYIEFDYDGYHRLVIPAAYGLNFRTGNLLLRAYQIGGFSSSRNVPLWDLFDVNKIINFRVLEDKFTELPPNYKKGDKAINRIDCEL